MRERTNEVEVERDVKVVMGDGAVLLTDLYHPVGVVDAPTILERTPYGRQGVSGGAGPEFAARGYRHVLQACRGTDGSGGSHSYFAEAPDGARPQTWAADEDDFERLVEQSLSAKTPTLIAARIDDKPAIGTTHRDPVQIRERFMLGLGVRQAM